MCIEIIATNMADIKTAVAAGVDRIELVSGLTEGGITPSYAFMENAIREAGQIPVMVMIRPHAVSFTMTHADMDVMEQDIRLVKKLGAKGVILGVITADKEVDTVLLDRLLPATQEMDVTFHKAFDRAKNLYEALDVILTYPQIKRILTSGGPGRVKENLNVLQALKEKAAGKVILLPGGEMPLEDLPQIRTAHISAEIHLGIQVRKSQKVLETMEINLIKQAMELWKH